MDIQPIDYVALAQSRITQQYRDKPKFMALVAGLASLAEEGLENSAANLFSALDIDIMEGANLDVIGRIVGQSREIIDYSNFEFFGFVGASDSGGFGSSQDPNAGARFIAKDEQTTGVRVVGDPEYRTFIKARILKNYATGTPEDFIEAILVLLNVDQVHLTESIMGLDVQVLGVLDPNDVELIEQYDILPRPTGVEITGVSAYSALAFSGVPLSIISSGAGYSVVNGEYLFVGAVSGKPKYENAASGYILYWQNYYFDWVIYDETLDEVYYAGNGDIEDILPPKTGWLLDLGDPPAPTLEYNTTRIIYPTDAAYNLGTNDLDFRATIIFKDSVPTLPATIYSQYIFGEGWHIKIENNRLVITDETTTNQVFSSVNSIKQNVLYRIQITKSGTTGDVEIYLNGVLDSSGTIAADLLSASVDIGIGHLFKGIIQNVQLKIAGALVIDSMLDEGTGTVATNAGTGTNGVITDPIWQTNL